MCKNFRVFPWKGILSKLCSLLYQHFSTPLSKQIDTVPLSDLPRWQIPVLFSQNLYKNRQFNLLPFSIVCLFVLTCNYSFSLELPKWEVKLTLIFHCSWVPLFPSAGNSSCPHEKFKVVVLYSAVVQVRTTGLFRISHDSL